MQKSNGYVLFENDSIVCIVTGFTRTSENEKTGAMLQSWILVKETNPVDAIFRGLDDKVCGNCPLRGELGKGRKCYVNLATAPYQIYKSWKSGLYPILTDFTLFKGKTLRLGSYGDPVVVPLEVWQQAIANVDGHTGYTHQWRTNPRFGAVVMASCDSAVDQIEASSQGWRTFRIKTPGQPLFADEISCPASEEGGRKTQCNRCQLCNGAGKARNVAINAHGTLKSHFE